MTFRVHNHRYEGSAELHSPLEWPDMRIEHRRVTPDTLHPVRFTCTSMTVALVGETPVRRTAGRHIHRAVIRPGMAAVEPAGFDETEAEIDHPLETLHVYLAPSVIGQSALADHGIDPARAELAYAGGLWDPLLTEIGRAFLEILSRRPESTDRLFIEGARAMLVAHLIAKYATLGWRPTRLQPSLSDQKMKRVFDIIESRFAEGISLSELAAEACLSQFHFSRLFKQATGLSPYRYVTERRIEDAKAKLAEPHLSLVEIALEAGFGSQGNFNRIFRKSTGLTPGQFRMLRRG